MCSYFENHFLLQPKNWHNSTTVLYTKYVHNTKNYFPPQPKNYHNTTTVLYSKYMSMYVNQNLFPARTKNWHNIQHNWKKGSSSPRAASVFVSLSVFLSVSKG
jgi:hypothetical protein